MNPCGGQTPLARSVNDIVFPPIAQYAMDGAPGASDAKLIEEIGGVFGMMDLNALGGLAHGLSR